MFILVSDNKLDFPRLNFMQLNVVPAHLVLESGEMFSGFVPDWFEGSQMGEVVFNTGMVGYTEVMTDPSYRGQIVVFTYPMIGNYGVESREYWESDAVHVSGIIVSELSQNDEYARTKAEQSLEAWCRSNNIPILMGLDTRALTKVLREKGVVSGSILTASISAPKVWKDINNNNLVGQVSNFSVETTLHGKLIKSDMDVRQSAVKEHILCIDCGMKANILRILEDYNVEITRVPYDYDFRQMQLDGIFISNGPGDPKMCVDLIQYLSEYLKLYPQTPVFGICLGAQILALALGAKTYKMKFGHRAQNHPCLEVLTGKSYLTSQNHGYAIDADTLPSDWRVSFVNLNDQSVQGIAHLKYPQFAVQFHPEAGPGPNDTRWLFDVFIGAVKQNKIEINY